MSSFPQSLPAKRIVSSLLALLVLIVTLPGPQNWVCMLKTGSLPCCCISIEVAPEADAAQSCCFTAELDREDPQKDPQKDPLGEGDDGEQPCDCGGDGPEQLSGDPKDGDDGSLAGSIAHAAAGFAWPMAVPRQIGADHETQERCTGPPLYVLYEVFLI